ncbi:MAG: CRISPR-associated endonuclease Cas1 [Deltaproteobacteria bacterium]|nr:MAG: CRISPR-associated endonuclease Cas1 [Deltaproteobacteria bacterium]
MVVYVTQQGAEVVREGRHLLVRKGDTIYHTLFTYKLEQLILCGRVGVTTPALQLLMREEIDTVFLRFDGRYCGRLASAEPKNVFVRKRQFELADDAAFCLRQARAIIDGKLRNMQTVLQRIARTRRGVDLSAPLRALKEGLASLERTEDLQQVRGIEGAGAAAYFSGLRLGLEDDFGFVRRVRRPPTDPVNAVLSLLYTLLINRLYAAVRLAGLDPYPGVLHSLDYGRQALPLDLVEEFRASLADTLALALFNRKVLKRDDFEIHRPEPLDLPEPAPMPVDAAVTDPLGRMSNLDAEDAFDLPAQELGRGDVPDEDTLEQRLPVRLTHEAFRRVIEAFEKKLQTEFFHPLAEQRMTYAEALVWQARQYRRVIQGEQQVYQPLLLR